MIISLIVRSLVGVALLAAAALAVAMVRKGRHQSLLRSARASFQLRREWLEADFLTRASARGLPRGLRWSDCQFEDAVVFARDRRSRQLRALIAVTIRFEAIDGGGMEEVEAVSMPRAATAVFFYDGKSWSTDGKAIFNLNPAETMRHYEHELEPVSDASLAD